MEEAMPFGVVADLPATYVAFDTLNERGAKGARVIGLMMSGRLKHLPRTDSWGPVRDLGARTSR
jgi:hypothetical protein